MITASICATTFPASSLVFLINVQELIVSEKAGEVNRS